MRLIRTDAERDRDLRIEGLLAAAGEVVTGAEVDSVVAGFEPIGSEVGDPSVGGDARGDRLTGGRGQRDGNPRAGRPAVASRTWVVT
jgi:hypothetical protein